MLTPPTLEAINPVESFKCKGSWSLWQSQDTQDTVRAHKIPCHENSNTDRLTNTNSRTIF